MPPVDPNVAQVLAFAQRRANACGVPYTIARSLATGVVAIRGKFPRYAIEIVYPE